jgi:CRISPR-associated protein Csb2
MATILAIRFPLGRYHGTPWNRSVNEGAAEWPPSPWRVLRALLATWHTRWPELPDTEISGLLAALAEPPSYRTPPAAPGHTRHYLPDRDHMKGTSGRTDLTLDPFLRVPRDQELLIRWEADLDPDRRAALAKLAGLMPYLGRAESACQARLADDDTAPDQRWWRPGEDGEQRTRLLAPAAPVTRQILEVTTEDVRKQRRTLPPGTIWVDYAADPAPRPSAAARRPPEPVTAIRYAVTGRAPLKAASGVLLADRAHHVAGLIWEKACLPDAERQQILGTAGAATGHRHAHWIPLPEGPERGARVSALVVWVPCGLSAGQVAALVRPMTLSGRLGGRGGEESYEVRGFPEVKLIFQGAGTIAQMAPELCGPASSWRSLTPYLPVRHRKGEPLADFLTRDVCTELGYRDHGEGSVIPEEAEDRMPDRWAREFRRYRLTENMSRSRPGLSVRLQFREEIEGPLLLGQLSHFGYGIFVPDTR